MFVTSQTIGGRLILTAVVLLVADSRGVMADEANATKPAVFELTVSPAAEPVPALKYHLLPPPEDRVRGDAAPIYLRVIWEQKPEWHKFIREEPRRLLKFSLAELPMDEAQKAVDAVSRELDQLAAASLRTDCNWEYVAEEDPLLILLPDAQSMRTFAFALALQTRIDIREDNPRGAVNTLRNGLALGSNIARAPYLVTALVGLAISESMLNELDQVVACERAPNLYWALAELPDPIISFRDGLATDSALIRARFPELEVYDASIDWSSLSQRMRKWAVQVASWELPNKPAAEIDISVPPERLAMARGELPKISDFTAEQAAAMSDAEIEVRYTIALHRIIFDEWRKWYYTPYDQLPDSITKQMKPLQAEAERRELYPLVSILSPLRGNLRLGQERLTRQIARQQVIEALRMHAAAEGSLPGSLEDVQVVPVPVDPATGRSFAYKLDGDLAVLDVEDVAGMTRDSLRLPVRIRLRK